MLFLQERPYEGLVNMSIMKRDPYQRKIQKITKCTPHDAVKIAQIMRDDVLHTAALDWLSASEFEKAARQAVHLLDMNRAEYEEYFARVRAMFEQGKAATSQ